MTEIDRERMRETDRLLPRQQAKVARSEHERVAGSVPANMFGESVAGVYLEKLLRVHNVLFQEITGAAHEALDDFGRAFVKVADNVDRAEEEAENEYRKVDEKNSQIDTARERARNSDVNRDAQQSHQRPPATGTQPALGLGGTGNPSDKGPTTTTMPADDREKG